MEQLRLDETELIKMNPYLTEKITRSRKDMEEGKGEKIDIKDLWNDLPNVDHS